ncbi:methylated-DNA--[protein]-cysteine S-methyltransferase [Marinimicrobium alkaliphilum]|uniref:methylated-DNA--[protein]-cysteine S-methyltransferase n=1 Tax=Marinimicrobium alkaliphilum TaxID=2202654 RepID=UPI0018E06767|nr:methylated-DNA--[protein]-cysteine S-methyltransferase [Marinimicrobium alkaliphilum]
MTLSRQAAAYFTYVAAPVGQLLIAGDGDYLTHIAFVGERAPSVVKAGWQRDDGRFRDCARQLSEYFSGRRRAFDLPLAAEGTEFQRRVWSALRTIPYGETCSYGDIARAIDSPKASRAVGAAAGANPIAIVVPCHRVIGTSGKLVGFAGGLSIKSQLLQLESRTPTLL